MDLRTALKDGREILRGLGLTDWTLSLDRAKQRAGCCHYSTRSITISEVFVRMNDWQLVRETILHEAAHALVGANVGHGWAWRSKCYDLGISGERCYDRNEVAMPKGEIAIECPVHGEIGRRHRMPKRGMTFYCKKCHSHGNHQPVSHRRLMPWELS